MNEENASETPEIDDNIEENDIPEDHSSNHFDPIPPTYDDPKKVPPADIAEEFLNDVYMRPNNLPLIRYWKEDFYEFDGCKWSKWSEKELKIKLNRYLQETYYRPIAGTGKTNDIVRNLMSMVHISALETPPLRVESNGACTALDRCVFTKNGIIDFKKLISDPSGNYFTPNGPENFILNTINADYIPDATCSNFHQFLERVQPNPAYRELLQKMVGLLLIPDTSFQRFFILEGNGGTGKTTFLNVIKGLLGLKNISAISLESFSASRTFPLMEIDGKLANICEDMSEIDKVEEGILKTLVCGGEFNAEKKYKDPVTFKPTARLLFATNVLPQFSDRTEGIWRRLIMIHFGQIIPQAEQNRSLASSDYWEKSGELSGILNWALEGLRQLMERGKFDVPLECELAVDEYKNNSNPAAEYLKMHVVENSMGRISSRDLYFSYVTWAKDEGYRKLTRQKFEDEIKRMFPKVERSINAVWVKGIRMRVWDGITWNTENVIHRNFKKKLESESSETDVAAISS